MYVQLIDEMFEEFILKSEIHANIPYHFFHSTLYKKLVNERDCTEKQSGIQ